MEKGGKYSVRRSRITERFTQVPEGPVSPTAALAAKEFSGGSIVFLNRATGWIVAVLLGVLVLGVAAVGTMYVLRAHHEDQVRKRIEDLETEIERQKTQNQAVERRLVEIETALEDR